MSDLNARTSKEMNAWLRNLKYKIMMPLSRVWNLVHSNNQRNQYCDHWSEFDFLLNVNKVFTLKHLKMAWIYTFILLQTGKSLHIFVLKHSDTAEWVLFVLMFVNVCKCNIWYMYERFRFRTIDSFMSINGALPCFVLKKKI